MTYLQFESNLILKIKFIPQHFYLENCAQNMVMQQLHHNFTDLRI